MCSGAAEVGAWRAPLHCDGKRFELGYLENALFLWPMCGDHTAIQECTTFSSLFLERCAGWLTDCALNQLRLVIHVVLLQQSNVGVDHLSGVICDVLFSDFLMNDRDD